MPTISTFYGVTVQMFWDDHWPPHFHAIHGDDEVLVDIRTMEVLRGTLPRRALALVLEWAVIHRKELLENWDLCANKRPPKRIRPLV